MQKTYSENTYQNIHKENRCYLLLLNLWETYPLCFVRHWFLKRMKQLQYGNFLPLIIYTYSNWRTSFITIMGICRLHIIQMTSRSIKVLWSRAQGTLIRFRHRVAHDVFHTRSVKFTLLRALMCWILGTFSSVVQCRDSLTRYHRSLNLVYWKKQSYGISL